MAIWRRKLLAVGILAGVAVVARGEAIGVSLRVDRTATTDSANAVDFGAAGLPELPGRVVTGRTPGGIPITAKRVPNGYVLNVAGATGTILFEGSIALEAGGLPYVVRNVDRALLWIPHYRAEGVLTVGPCRERVVVFDDDANGRFDDVVGVDLYRDGRFRFARSFDFCGRMLSVEMVAADGSSIVFREAGRLVAQVGQPAPAVTLATLDSAVVKTAQRRPKPLLLDFWASWCDVCLGEFAAIRKLHESGLVQIVSVNVDESAQMGTARSILRQQKPLWAQVLTGQGTATSAWQAFAPLTDSGGMPLYALIDQDGALRYAGTGGGAELPEVNAALAKLR